MSTTIASTSSVTSTYTITIHDSPLQKTSISWTPDQLCTDLNKLIEVTHRTVEGVWVLENGMKCSEAQTIKIINALDVPLRTDLRIRFLFDAAVRHLLSINVPTIAVLPTDALNTIFSFLDLEDIRNCRLINSQMLDTCLGVSHLSLKMVHRNEEKLKNIIHMFPRAHSFDFPMGGPEKNFHFFLNTIPHIRSLNLKNYSYITDKELVFSKKCSSLLSLNLSKTGQKVRRFSQEELANFLDNFPYLEYLNLNNCSQLTSLSFLKKCPHLKALKTVRCSLKDESLTFLYYCPRLTSLSISGKISDEGLTVVVAACPELEYLFFFECPDITILGIAYLKSLKKLRDCSVSYCKISSIEVENALA